MTEQTQRPIPPSPSVSDVLREYYELDLPTSSADMKPLDAETLDVLHRVEGYTDPVHLVSQLISALQVLWTARKSGELADDDADAMLWLLSEVSSLIEHAAEANKDAAWWQGQHEKATIRAETKSQPTTRRRAKRKGPSA